MSLQYINLLFLLHLTAYFKLQRLQRCMKWEDEHEWRLGFERSRAWTNYLLYFFETS
jgi:hypothetical protein